jgi:hypothetical protein
MDRHVVLFKLRQKLEGLLYVRISFPKLQPLRVIQVHPDIGIGIQRESLRHGQTYPYFR